MRHDDRSASRHVEIFVAHESNCVIEWLGAIRYGLAPFAPVSSGRSFLLLRLGCLGNMFGTARAGGQI